MMSFDEAIEKAENELAKLIHNSETLNSAGLRTANSNKADWLSIVVYLAKKGLQAEHPDSDKIKKAMHKFTPVQYKGIKYDRITAYTYRVVETHKRGTYRTTLQCELLDRSGHSVTIAEAGKVELV